MADEWLELGVRGRGYVWGFNVWERSWEVSNIGEGLNLRPGHFHE